MTSRERGLAPRPAPASEFDLAAAKPRCPAAKRQSAATGSQTALACEPPKRTVSVAFT
jgi:hypothetical protein